MKLMMEKAKVEAENQEVLRKKDEELEQLKAQLDAAKAEAEEQLKAKNAAELKLQHENLQQAMVDLQVVQEKKEEPSSTQKILEKTSFIEDESFDDR